MLAIVGWATGARIWASFGSQYIPMAPTTAFFFMLLSVSVVVCVRAHGIPLWRRIGTGAVILVGVGSLVALGDFLTGARWSYESFFVAHPDRFGLVLTGRLSPVTAAGMLILCSVTLLLLRSAHYPLIGGLVALVAGGALLVLAAYVYHAPLLYGGRTIPVALTTDLAFLSLVTAFMIAIGPDHFPLRPFWGPSARAVLLRVFLPVTVAIVAFTGILAGVSGRWNPALASASAVLISSALVTVVVSRLATRIGGTLDDARLKIQALNTQLARQIDERTEQLVATQRAEARAEQQLRRVAALRTIDLAITASMDLRITLQTVVEQVVAQLHADAVAVLLLNQHTYVLDYAAGHGFHHTAIEHVQLRLGEGLAGRVAQERQLVAVPNLVSQHEHVARTDVLAAEGFVAYHGAPLISKGQVTGVLEVFHRTTFNPDDEWGQFLEALAGQAAIAIDNGTLFEELQRSHADLVLAYDSTIEGWSRALDLRDRETEGHSQRVTAMALRLARALGVPDAELVHIRRGGLLHDIGKMGIPDRVLHKRGPLNDDERQIMQRHAVHAYALLSPIAHLRAALEIPYCHHEWWDGTGYPRGLAGEQIPLAARIFAVVDVWDALRSHRPYRPAWGRDRALAHIREQAGSHFDPRVVEVFLQMVEALEDMSPNAPTRPGVA